MTSLAERPPSWHLCLGIALWVVFGLVIGLMSIYLLAHWSDPHAWE